MKKSSNLRKMEIAYKAHRIIKDPNEAPERRMKAQEILNRYLSGEKKSKNVDNRTTNAALKNSGEFDSELMLLAITVGGFHVEAGAKSFPEYAQIMISDVGPEIRPYLMSVYNSVKGYPGFDSTGMDSYTDVEAYQERINDGEPISNLTEDSNDTSTSADME